MFLLWTMFLAGLLHGLGPDHLAAIAALAGHERRRASEQPAERPQSKGDQGVTWLGLRFALGHVVSLLGLAAVLGWLGREMPSNWQQRLEQLGGVILVFLGGWMLAHVFARRVTAHEHAHSHGRGENRNSHEHLHIHLGRVHGMHRHPHPAWIIGGLMGFSGARALLTAAPLVIAGSIAVVIARAAAFGVGIVISMVAAGWFVARLSQQAKTPSYARLVVALTGVLSAAVGLFWLTVPPGS